MSCHRFEPIQSRREFLARTGLGFGAAALAHLFRGVAFAASAAGVANDGAGGHAPFPREGEARDLSVPVRGTVASGSLRSETGIERAVQRGSAGFCPSRPANYGHGCRAEATRAPAEQVWFPARG